MGRACLTQIMILRYGSEIAQLSSQVVTAVAPIASAILGAALILAVRARASLSGRLWMGWAGLTGGSIATAALSGEWLGTGWGGYAIGFLGGVGGAGLASLVLSREPSGVAIGARESGSSTRGEAPGTSKERLAGLGITASVFGLALVLAAAGVGWVGFLLIAVLCAVALTTQGYGLAEGFFLAVGLLSAAVVLASKLVLSPLGDVGSAVPTMAVISLAAAPLLVIIGRGQTWRSASSATSIVDAVPVVIATTAALTWLSLFRPLSSSEAVAQLVPLGEDHISHLLMLEATRRSQTSLGTSAASIEVTDRFSDYFPGGSTWQSSVGALVGTDATVQTYLISTALLIALLAGCAVSAAGRSMRRFPVVAAAGVLFAGAIGLRATLAMYELGFPGHLLAAVWVTNGLVLLLPRERRMPDGSPTAAILFALALATWWTWNLAAPILLLPAGALLIAALRERRSWSRRLVLAFGASLTTLVVAGVAVKHEFILVTLHALNTEGGVFRAIPFWMAFLLILALPLAVKLGGQEVPVGVTALALGMGAATVALITWQSARIGMPTYYGYKLQYLLLALGWAAGALAVRVALERPLRPSWTRPGAAALGVAAMALAVSVPVVAWVGDSYRGWLDARGVVGADPALACAVRASSRLPDGSTAVAVGFGEPLSNYLTTRAMDVGTGNNLSAPLWSPVLNQPDPQTWPWGSVKGQVYLIEGPSSASPSSAEVLAAAREAGVDVASANTIC